MGSIKRRVELKARRELPWMRRTGGHPNKVELRSLCGRATLVKHLHRPDTRKDSRATFRNLEPQEN
jgi:hypothetical protein